MVSRTNSNNSLSTEVVDLTTHDQDYYPVDWNPVFFNFNINTIVFESMLNIY